MVDFNSINRCRVRGSYSAGYQCTRFVDTGHDHENTGASVTFNYERFTIQQFCMNSARTIKNLSNSCGSILVGENLDLFYSCAPETESILHFQSLRHLDHFRANPETQFQGQPRDTGTVETVGPRERVDRNR